MDSTNKVLALFVGLFVVILLIGVGVSRLAKNKKPIGGSLGEILNEKVTPAPIKPTKNTTILITTPVPTGITSTTGGQPTPPTNIPETGATTIPLIFASLGTGLLLLKNTKRV